MKARNYTCFKLEGKATRSAKKNKKMINVRADKFTKSNITKKLFSCISSVTYISYKITWNESGPISRH